MGFGLSWRFRAVAPQTSSRAERYQSSSAHKRRGEREERKEEERRGEETRLDRGIQGICFLTETDKVKDPSTVMATETTSCTGSTVLKPLSDMVDLPLDQVNCHLFLKTELTVASSVMLTS